MTLRRLVFAFVEEIRDPEFRNIIVLLLIVLCSGTFFYHRVEEWRVLDALFFSIITLSTVGYGDFSPQTDIGKVFTIFYIFVGLGLFFAVIDHLAKGIYKRQKKLVTKTKEKLPHHPKK